MIRKEEAALGEAKGGKGVPNMPSYLSSLTDRVFAYSKDPNIGSYRGLDSGRGGRGRGRGGVP